jgi:hypothetical protein
MRESGNNFEAFEHGDREVRDENQEATQDLHLFELGAEEDNVCYDTEKYLKVQKGCHSASFLIAISERHGYLLNKVEECNHHYHAYVPPRVHVQTCTNLILGSDGAVSMRVVESLGEHPVIRVNGGDEDFEGHEYRAQEYIA